MVLTEKTQVKNFLARLEFLLYSILIIVLVKLSPDEPFLSKQKFLIQNSTVLLKFSIGRVTVQFYYPYIIIYTIQGQLHV